MSIYFHILNQLKNKKLHLTLLDPDKQSIEKGVYLAERCEALGTDYIMIGGSTNISSGKMDELILGIKERVKLPVIIFPNGVGAISKHADAIFFMSMLNSKNLNFVIRQQVIGAEIVKKFGLEPISMAYLIVEPGMTVGKVGEAELIKRTDTRSAVNYALAGEYLGMKLIYLEAGSGAPEPVPASMVREVKSSISVPLIVGGGIRNADDAKAIIDAGANAIVTGTIVEKKESELKSIIEAVKS